VAITGNISKTDPKISYSEKTTTEIKGVKMGTSSKY
jgi:hypothetical protein